MLHIEGLNDNIDTKPDRLATDDHNRTDGLVITKLTSGVKSPSRVNVFINGKFALSLDVGQVVDLGVKAGRRIDEKFLQELHQASEFGKLYQRALEWTLTRPHSVRETRDYLKRRQSKRIQTNRKRVQDELKPYPEIQDSVIDLVIKRLVERGYVDDVKFAEYYVENRFVKKGVSKKRLELELRKKGIADEVAKSILAASERDDKIELEKIVQKKWQKYDKAKMINYLVRQGFRYDDVLAAVNQKYGGSDSYEW